jgi:hypothetical protein
VTVVAALVAGGCASGAATTGAGAPTHAAASAHHRRMHHRRARRHRAPAPGRRRGRAVPAADRPDPRLTPGAVLTTSLSRICVRGYSASVRDVPETEKADVYARYGVADVPDAHEVDHLVSLELGGSNAVANLWPEPYAGRWGARTKDVLENRLHDLVCAGRLALRRAQRIEARNWVAAYGLYVGGTPVSAPPPGSGGGSGRSPGGYYASSYPTASTIYCADDSEWRTLSSRFLVHFATYAQAIARFPGYHLHRSC